MCEIIDYWTFDNIVTILTLIIGVIGLTKALVEYTRAQKWKKAEFLAKEVKDFYADKSVQRALLMLDWNIISIPLFDSEMKSNNQKTFDFDDEIFEKALKHHNETTFVENETIVRKTMDDFLVKLSMFQNYIDSGLIKTKDLKPYFDYWIELIGNDKLDRKSKGKFEQLWRFINYYEYRQIIKLFDNFGYNIKTEERPTG
jgi:hypothetical protein